ncbi:MAG TPA: DUF1573 domain-containing protein [Pirellulales bacterium]
MRRSALLSLLLVLAWSTAAPAQEWARKMFTDTSHDFGSLARGAKAQYQFKFTNPYVEPLHIAAVRSSCGCTTVEKPEKEIKTWESADIVANFNTNAFLGVHSATITVTFDRPYAAEVQLQVNGNILSDVVLQPGLIELGTVDAGQGAEKKIVLTHTGRSDWSISDVQSANTNFEVEVNENRRINGSVVYDLLVRLKPSSPAGYINDQLFLVTNDPEAPRIPVDVVGRVVAEVTVSPASLALGTLAPGQAVTKNIVIRSKKPFRVLGIVCDDEFSCKLPDDAREVQLIPITFTAPHQSGKIAKTIKIKTDLGDNVVPEVTCQATVVDASTAPVHAAGNSTSSGYHDRGGRTAEYYGQ